jgi:hypothetical protein
MDAGSRLAAPRKLNLRGAASQGPIHTRKTYRHRQLPQQPPLLIQASRPLSRFAYIMPIR